MTAPARFEAAPTAGLGADPSAGFSLAEQAATLDRDLQAAPPMEIIAAARAHLPAGRLAVVSSFGTEAAPLLYLVAQVDPALPVLFVDTGWLFPETLTYRDAIVARLGLTDVRSLTATPAALAAEDPDRELWMTDADACCRLRKVVPLRRALEPFAGWINGRKRYHGGERAALPVVEVDGARLKFNPFANVAPDELGRIFAAADLPRHPLEAQGYRSVGCLPCTSKTRPGEDIRSGRWRGKAKTECGIHFSEQG